MNRGLIKVLLLLLPSVFSYGQGQQSAVNRAMSIIVAESMPRNDAVLAAAPTQLDLAFSTRVRLVKMVLYTQNQQWIDVNFRYDPRPGFNYSVDLPPLQDAAYYIVHWALLNSRDELIRGDFSFSFGGGAEPPSVVMAREQILLDRQRDNYLDILELDRLGIDPAEIIINNQPRRQFEPPFAPVLN